jgi:hypothetical protein
MKRLLLALGLILAGIVSACQPQDASDSPTKLPPIKVYLSRKGGCTEATDALATQPLKLDNGGSVFTEGKSWRGEKRNTSRRSFSGSTWGTVSG